FEHCRSRAQAAQQPRDQIAALKQAAFFAIRAFDKGNQAPAWLQEYIDVLVRVQQRAPTPSFRRKCAEMRSVAAGRSHAAAVLRKIGRPASRPLVDEATLGNIETVLAVTLPATYKHFLMTYAHHTIGAYEPFQAVELADQVHAAWAYGVPQYL